MIKNQLVALKEKNDDYSSVSDNSDNQFDNFSQNEYAKKIDSLKKSKKISNVLLEYEKTDCVQFCVKKCFAILKWNPVRKLAYNVNLEGKYFIEDIKLWKRFSSEAYVRNDELWRSLVNSGIVGSDDQMNTTSHDNDAPVT